MSRQSIRTGRTVVVVRYRAGVRTCRCMPGSWVVSTGGTWGRDSKGGVGLQGAGCRVQGAGCRRCECRREGQVQVQQGAAGCSRVRKKCGRCRRRGDKQGCRGDLARVPACDNVPSALVDHTCVWLPGWNQGARERYAGTRAKDVRMHSSLPYHELQTWLATQS